MTVSDVLQVLSAHDTALAVVLGVLVAAFLCRTVINWFADTLMRSSDWS